jgi:hypothetical protein
MTYAFIAIALGLTIISFYLRKSVLATGAGLSWILLGFQSYGMSSAANPGEITDVYMGLFWMCIIMCIVCIFEAVYMRPKNEIGEEAALDFTETEKLEEEYEHAWRETGAPTFCHRKTKRGKINRALKRL